jgi:hypothetical protein|tara:strand:- start:12 stop:236 length:225 start_codon:yes stop_codon:yes gene_type:complete
VDHLEAILLRVAENFTCSSHLVQIELLAILCRLLSENAPGKNASEIVIISGCDGFFGEDGLRIGGDHDVTQIII